MPIYSLQIDENKCSLGLADLPENLPVYHHGRKVGLAFFDGTDYRIDLPHSLSYLIHIDHAVLKLIYSGDDRLSGGSAKNGSPESVQLVERERVSPPPSKIKLRTQHMRQLP